MTSLQPCLEEVEALVLLRVLAAMDAQRRIHGALQLQPGRSQGVAVGQGSPR